MSEKKRGFLAEFVRAYRLERARVKLRREIDDLRAQMGLAAGDSLADCDALDVEWAMLTKREADLKRWQRGES